MLKTFSKKKYRNERKQNRKRLLKTTIKITYHA